MFANTVAIPTPLTAEIDTVIPKHVKLTIPDVELTSDPNRVEKVKALRHLLGVPLKEAKELIESPGFHTVKVGGNFSAVSFYGFNENSDPEENYKATVAKLAALGIVVRPADISAGLVKNLEQLITSAVLEGSYDLAEDLILVLRRHV